MAAATKKKKKLMKAMSLKEVKSAAVAAANAVLGKIFAYVELFIPSNKFLAMR
jgi:hypothetical protein